MSKRTLIGGLMLSLVLVLAVSAQRTQSEGSTTPEWLYLVFTDSTSPQAAKVPTTTWLHPAAPESCARTFEESFLPEPVHGHKAFSFAITRVTPAGYEVTFQRIDSETQKPLDIAPLKVLFERARESSTRLTDKITVVGHYEFAPPFNDI